MPASVNWLAMTSVVHHESQVGMSSPRAVHRRCPLWPAVDRARELFRQAVYQLNLAWLMVQSWYRRMRAVAPCDATHHGPTAYRIYVFNESGEDGFYREVSPAYFDPDNWEQDAKDLTGWPKVRAEVRYTFRKKKYRMVLHEGDQCVFPPYAEPTAPACRLPKGVLSARLQGPLGSGIDCDVTARVMKYQGPRGDFHAGLGLHVRMHELLPFDDHADNCVRFSHLRIMDTLARLHDLPYEPNPKITLKP